MFTEEISGEEIISFARQHLAGYKVPRNIFVVADLPRLGSGKPDRRELASRAAASVSSAGVGA